ncbi:uncharacterized protein LOC111409522 [Olea europaea var. sylvestris]|uniref:uncharacterized protein LOC111409522 n=1 Tax=Olea europaea var. sylvestris TaxID=158386 RepID=UPI000C1D6477|nr:uncharacterized protein LOC111409522 [Olea europaea var. sylvestris]
MAYLSTIKSESDKESDKVDEEFHNNNLSNEDEDDIDIHEAYQLLFKEKKERHASNLQNSLKSVSELKCVNEKLEDKVKILTSELEKSNAHLQTFISGTKKLDDILGTNKPTGDRKGLGYVEGNTHGAGPSKTVFIFASRKSNAINSPNKGKNVSREQSHQSRRNFMPKHPQTRTFEPKFIPTCHHCGALRHTRPRCYKLGNERRNQNIPSHVSFLTNQVSHLIEMLTRLTRSTKSSKKVWVKKEDLAGLSGQVNCYVAHVALKAQDFNMWYIDSACSRHMCGNKTLFTTLDKCNGGMVTFGDGGYAPIFGKGTVQIHGLPVISNVLYVEGLKSNLLSISQICDADFEVSFLEKRCTVYDSFDGVVLEGVRTSNNCYGVLPNSNYVCRSAKIDVSELWHKRLGHLNYKSLVQLAKKELVDGLPKIGPSENVVCGPCQLDDFSRFTWVELLRKKSDACDLIKSLCKRLNNELNHKVSRMRSDHGKEFENFNLESFCMDEGILHEFSSPITPQQNGVVERKNHVLQDMARAMLHDKGLALYFWGEAVNTACHIINRVYLRPKIDQTPYEILKGKKPTVKYFRVFRRYFRNSRAFRVYNSRTRTVMESSDPTEPLVPESSLKIPETPEKETHPQDQDIIPKEPSTRVKSNHPKDNIIGDLDEGTRLRKRVLNNLAYTSYVSQVEPKKVEEALSDECWVNAMHEELNQFARNNVWILVPRPENCNVIVSPLCLQTPQSTLWSEQTPRAWYERLTSYLEEHGFSRGGADRTLFIRHIEETITIAQIYVDDIIFGSPIESLAYEFAERLKQEFEMSMVGELSYFLGLQVKQTEDGLFISQSKYAKNLAKRFGLDSKKHTRTPMSTSLKLGRDPSDDRKSTSGGCFYMDSNLVAWLSKKQNFISLSTAEAEYIAVGSCCTQLLWMKQVLSDYGINQGTMTVFCDNTSAINISKNPIQHSRTKHIYIRHHFIRELVETHVVSLDHVSTDNQLADLLTKPLDEMRFESLRTAIEIGRAKPICLVNQNLSLANFVNSHHGLYAWICVKKADSDILKWQRLILYNHNLILLDIKRLILGRRPYYHKLIMDHILVIGIEVHAALVDLSLSEN